MTDKGPATDDLWAQFIRQQKVQPLKASKRIAPTQTPKKPIKRPLSHSQPCSMGGEFDTLSDAFHTEHTPQGRIWWQRSSLRPQEIEKLKKGRFTTPWKLDLHGMTLEEAEPVLRQFLWEAWHLGARYALIIHGKGYNSETGKSVLKQMTHQLLPALPFVLAFSTAQPKDGDTGATYVFIKAHT